ncbi:MAG: hypothetical protein AMJ68_09150 [Acidithiobacillales bacterium SG8_45]|jgi:hypothetical protein|nr:MAG: hypothetical protein AMJ68_09150 [Acidithiobacillales bacterium SG8_45]
MKPETSLRIVRITHTVIWAILASTVLAIPVFGHLDEFLIAALLFGVVIIEGLVLLLNGWRCPLTDVAARYTGEESDNFDIYLPAWLARHNKSIFSVLFVFGSAYSIYRWLLAG